MMKDPRKENPTSSNPTGKPVSPSDGGSLKIPLTPPK